MKRLGVVLALLCGCVPDGGPLPAPAPLIGKADGSDSADRDCKVILRSLERTTEVDSGYFVWRGTVDVSTSLGGSVGALIYRPNGGQWYPFTGTPVDGAGAGFQRYDVRVDRLTTPTPAMELRSWEYQRAEVAVYALSPSGGRLFDHNRVSSDFTNYELTPSNDFAIGAAPGVCPSEAPRAQIDFKGDHSIEQHGSIVAGGKMTLTYALARLPQCRYSRAGYQLWDIEANVKFQPQGILVTRPVTMVITPGGMGPTRVAVPVELDVPRGTQYVDFWFRNFDGERCEAWDSNYGHNHRLGANALPAPVSWAGDWGNGFSRACTHRDGLEDPVRIDSYIRERACKFVDADVWVPNMTDPKLLWAQAEVSKDGAAPTYSFLRFVERVGNNLRFRWELPYEVTTDQWSRYDYSFRFSTDGNTFHTIGPKSIVRAF
jgi:hypothetical protein